MTSVVDSRVIYLTTELGRRQLRETLGSLLLSNYFQQDEIWLVSAWITDFDLIDNRSGNWSIVHPEWGARILRFSEILKDLIKTGTKIKIVTNNDPINSAFLKRLEGADRSLGPGLAYTQSEVLHLKGLLSSHYFLMGSMNFTYSGTNKKDEQVTLTNNPNILGETRLEYEERYGGLF